MTEVELNQTILSAFVASFFECFVSVSDADGLIARKEDWERFLHMSMSRGLFHRRDLSTVYQMFQPTIENPVNPEKIATAFRTHYCGSILNRFDALLNEMLERITDFTQVCDDWNITELEEGETKHVLRLVEGILELHTSCLNGLRDLIRKNEYFLGDEPGRLLFWQRLRSPTSRHCHLHIPPFWDAHWGGTVATAHDFQRVFVGEIEEALEKKRVDPKKLKKVLSLPTSTSVSREFVSVNDDDLEVWRIPYTPATADYSEWYAMQMDALACLPLCPIVPAHRGALTAGKEVWFIREHVKGVRLSEWLYKRGALESDGQYIRHWGRALLLGFLDILRMSPYMLDRWITTEDVVICNGGRRLVFDNVVWEGPLPDNGVTTISAGSVFDDGRVVTEEDKIAEIEEDRQPGGTLFRIESQLVSNFVELFSAMITLRAGELLAKTIQELIEEQERKKKSRKRRRRQLHGRKVSEEQAPADLGSEDIGDDDDESDEDDDLDLEAEAAKSKGKGKDKGNADPVKPRRRLSLKRMKRAMLAESTVRAIISGCQTKNPDMVPRLTDILLHPFFSRLDDAKISLMVAKFERDVGVFDTEIALAAVKREEGDAGEIGVVPTQTHVPGLKSCLKSDSQSRSRLDPNKVKTGAKLKFRDDVILSLHTFEIGTPPCGGADAEGDGGGDDGGDEGNDGGVGGGGSSGSDDGNPPATSESESSDSRDDADAGDGKYSSPLMNELFDVDIPGGMRVSTLGKYKNVMNPLLGEEEDNVPTKKEATRRMQGGSRSPKPGDSSRDVSPPGGNAGSSRYQRRSRHGGRSGTASPVLRAGGSTSPHRLVRRISPRSITAAAQAILKEGSETKKILGTPEAQLRICSGTNTPAGLSPRSESGVYRRGGPAGPVPEGTPVPVLFTSGACLDTLPGASSQTTPRSANSSRRSSISELYGDAKRGAAARYAAQKEDESQERSHRKGADQSSSARKLVRT